MIFQVAYFSAARPAITDADVRDILRASAKSNRRDGLSGMLLLLDGTFFQVLEGEKDRIEETLLRISSDPRHTGIVRVVEMEREEPSFPDWTMGFEKFMHGGEVDDALPFDIAGLSRNPSVEKLKGKAPELISFMRTLYTARGMRGAPELD